MKIPKWTRVRNAGALLIFRYFNIITLHVSIFIIKSHFEKLL